MRSISNSVLIVLMSVLLSSSAFAGFTYESGVGYAVLEGKVGTEDGSAISGTTIRIAGFQETTTTNSDGVYFLGVQTLESSQFISVEFSHPSWGTFVYKNALIGRGITRRISATLKKDPYEGEESSSTQGKYPTANKEALYPATMLLLKTLTTTKGKVAPKTLLPKNTFGWIFEMIPGWEISGYGTGEGDHHGDDYYAIDYNFYEPGSEKRDPTADEGKMLLSPISGEVIYAQQRYPACPVPVCWYGNQVIIYNSQDDVAVRLTHLKDVYVAVGQNVDAFDPIGTVGHSGLKGVSPYSSHLHLVAYQNVQSLSRRVTTSGKQYSGVYWMQFGLDPECITVCSGPTTFAKKFSLDTTKSWYSFGLSPRTSLLQDMHTGTVGSLEISQKSPTPEPTSLPMNIINPLFPPMTQEGIISVRLMGLRRSMEQLLPWAITLQS